MEELEEQEKDMRVMEFRIQIFKTIQQSNYSP